jgi:hypothetical protein
MFDFRLRSSSIQVQKHLNLAVDLGREIAKRLVMTTVLVSCLWLMLTPGAIAGLNDDNFDGNIYALYGGNGSLVPPRVSLEQSLSRDDRATILVFFLDDSSDCKQYTAVVSQLQAFYGRAADILPLNVDAIPVKDEYTTTEPGYYYAGVVPQTVVLDLEGKVVYDRKGQVSYESIDDVLRQVYDLLPRSESLELKRRAPNEVSVELSP